jgi:predicted nuclease of restriction endonuclease-like (RecB) superfamily
MEATELEKPEQALVDEISGLIEQSRRVIYENASKTTILLFCSIGTRINQDILQNKRAEYGKQIVSALATQLAAKYGRGFEIRNLRRMMQFSEQFTDFEIVSSLPTQLTWTHIVETLPLKSVDAKLYYLHESASRQLATRGLRKLIDRKAYERKEIANTRITSADRLPLDTFKDPYLFDILGLKDEYLEADLEEAVLRELEKFILEFGKGFTYADRQKRMIIDGKDFKLDLLFYNRLLKRLVAVDLKIGEFKAEYMGQMKLYLKWLDRYERLDGENGPIGLILCASGNHREQIELLEMDKDGIMVAEYWTTLPPKAEFEKKIHTLLLETRERMERRKLMLPSSTETSDGEIDSLYKPKEEDEIG